MKQTIVSSGGGWLWEKLWISPTPPTALPLFSKSSWRPQWWWVHTIAEVCNLSPEMYYYASPTLRSETTLPLKKTTARMLKTTTPCNRWKIFLLMPYSHVITFCLAWQHHDVFQTSATASKRWRIEPQSRPLILCSEHLAECDFVNFMADYQRRFASKRNL